MMYLQKRNSTILGTTLLLCAMLTNISFAQQRPTRDPLGFLKRALTEAGAPALTTDQETQITTLITAYKAAQPDEPSQALIDARTAMGAAILAGDLTTAQTQAGIISGLIAAENNVRLLALAKFGAEVIVILKNGGQLEYLVQKLSSERVVGLIESLAGRGGFGGGLGGGAGHGGPGRQE
ncbi:MAG: hypothetical protein JST84_19330 [Acidobacteria bacterium]|nr:hypothetical protein [Acidobacteriota bacterium]